MQQEPSANQERTDFTPPPVSGTDENKLIRIKKTIVVNPKKGGAVNESVVAFRYYNAFNYALLPREQKTVNLTLGITSANPREGKTLVASNLAVSLATGYQKKTILVDLNIQNPCLHKVFGVDLKPGLSDAFEDGQIQISPTRIEHLSVLSAGTAAEIAAAQMMNNHPPLGLEHFASFRDIIYSLEQEFDFVIVDMPAVHPHGFPTLFANQLNGLLIVVDAGRTKRGEIDAIFRHFNEHLILGFVMNRVPEDNDRGTP